MPKNTIEVENHSLQKELDNPKHRNTRNRSKEGGNKGNNPTQGKGDPKPKGPKVAKGCKENKVKATNITQKNSQEKFSQTSKNAAKSAN